MPRPPLSSEGRWQTDGLRVTLHRFKATKKGVLKTPLNFQVAPLESFGFTQAANFTDFDTLSRGQFSRRGARALISFDIRTFVIDYQPSWVSWERSRPNAPHPQKVTQLLKHLTQLGTPMMFVARSGFWEGNDLRIPVTLRSMAVEERAGEVDSRYFDLSFVEWREQELDRRKLGGKRERHSLPTTVVIHEDGSVSEVGDSKEKIPQHDGDFATLHDLAQHYYGDPTVWRVIVLENGIDNFPPGRSLKDLEKGGKRVRKLRIPRLVEKVGEAESLGS